MPPRVVLWDFQSQKDKLVITNQLDIVVVAKQKKKTVTLVAEQQDLARFNNDSHLCCVPTRHWSKLLLEYRKACSEAAIKVMEGV